MAAHSWEDKGGLHIDKVWRNSPADRIGIHTRDVMLQFAGKPVPDYETFRQVDVSAQTRAESRRETAAGRERR